MRVSDPRLVGITNDVFEDDGKHYVTLWFEAAHLSGEAAGLATYELTEVGWFHENALPEALFLPLRNLLQGRVVA